MLDAGFACPDWWEKLQRGETPIPALDLDEVEAECAVAMFNKLRVPDIPGQPTFGEVGGEWIRDIIRAAFGSIDRETGARLVGEIFNLVPKKNSKTTNAAAIGLVALMMNRRPNIDGVIIGPTQEVAQKCFDQAAAMIRADAYLVRRFKIIEHQKTIIDLSVDEDTGIRLNAKLKIKSFDPKIVTGSIPAFAILDELHVMAESAHAARVIGQIRGGMITNPESLLIIITTQSEIPPSGVFKSELEYARNVRDGLVTEGVRMLPVLYEFPLEIQADEERPWKNPALWSAILPNLGRSITLDRLVEMYKGAVDKGLEEEIRWASQHLNIEIGVGLHADRWPGAIYWTAAALEGLTLETLIAECEVACVGIDGGGLDDLAALAVIGRHRKTRNWMLWARAWAQPEVFVQRKLIAARLRDFERSGDLIIHDGGDQDAIEMAEICVRLKRAGLLPEKYAVGLDAYGVATLIDELDSCGINGDQIMSVGQGWKLQSAILTLPRKIKDKTFRHAGSDMMNWCVGNAKTELRG
ncbi:MAG: terminase large subunit, partial [Deltaproteobacteria bacterium]